MELYELKKEQIKLSSKVELRGNLTKIKTIGGVECVVAGKDILACVVVCEYPSLKLIEKKTYLLSDPLPYRQGFSAYREMPAMIEAYNQLEQEPDLLLVYGEGIAHPRKLGIASHLGVILNKPTVGITNKLVIGKVEQGKIMLNNEIVGFEIKTREHANPVYASPGHLVSLGSVLDVVSRTIRFPHKMPEPLHLAKKIAKHKVKDLI